MGPVYIRDELQWVGNSRVICEARVIEIHSACVSVEDDILQNGAETDGIVDIGLLLTGETDGLGIAAPLNVEDTFRVPHMLVIPDQVTLGIRTERRLASAGETEADRHIIVLPNVCRGMERQGSQCPLSPTLVYRSVAFSPG